MGAVYYYGQDGEKVDATIKTLFNLDEKELRWSTAMNASVYDFVGFVFKENNILVVFPKHYTALVTFLCLITLMRSVHTTSNFYMES